MLIWIGFFLSLILLLVVARKNLWLGLFTGAIVLGLFNLNLEEFAKVTFSTVINVPILLLALAVGLIPLIGGALQTTGLLNDLVDNLQMKRKIFLGFAPAFMGLLPLPGGALLSAPMLKKAGDDIPSESYAAINVWFRHILIMIYPLGALLPCSKMAEINLYDALLYIFPAFLILFILGYVFLLHHISGKMPSPARINYRKLMVPILIILSAPIIHIILTHLGVMDEVSLLIGISMSLLLCLLLGKMKPRRFVEIFFKMKPWKFFLIIIGIFLFLNIFKAADISNEIAAAVFSMNFLIVIIAALLGFLTGRIQLPVSIIIPIFIAKYSATALTVPIFAILYSSIFIGYMLSPVHPCVSISLEYFKTGFRKFSMKLALPGAIGLIIFYLVAELLI